MKGLGRFCLFLYLSITVQMVFHQSVSAETLPPTPVILEPLPNTLYGGLNRISDDKIQIPFTIKCSQDVQLRLKITKLIPNNTSRTDDQFVIGIPSVLGVSDSGGMIYNFKINLEEGLYSATAIAESIDTNDISFSEAVAFSTRLDSMGEQDFKKRPVGKTKEDLKTKHQLPQHLEDEFDPGLVVNLPSDKSRMMKSSIRFIHPTQNEIFDYSDPYKGLFYVSIDMTERQDIELRVMRKTELVYEETIKKEIILDSYTNRNGEKIWSYAANATILPIGKYTIQARQIEALNGNWTSPITFYTGNEAVFKDSVAVAKTNGLNQHSGDSPLFGGVNVSKGRSTVVPTTPLITPQVRKGVGPVADGHSAPTPLPLPRGAAFSVNSLTSLPVKHAAGQKPEYEFEYYDGRAWRKERSIRPISMQTPQGNGMTQVITKTSFRISKPGKYRYRVKTDASGSPSSPYQEFVVVDPRAQSMAQAIAQSSRAQAAAANKPSAAGAPAGAVNIAKSPARTETPRPPANSADLRRGTDTAAPQVPGQRQLMPPSAPPRITAPRPSQAFTAPANVMVQTSHDARFDLVFEMSMGAGKPQTVNDGNLRQLAPGKYLVKVGYKGRTERSQVDFWVHPKKRAVQAQPQPQKAPAAQPAPRRAAPPPIRRSASP